MNCSFDDYPKPVKTWLGRQQDAVISEDISVDLLIRIKIILAPTYIQLKSDDYDIPTYTYSLDNNT